MYREGRVQQDKSNSPNTDRHGRKHAQPLCHFSSFHVEKANHNHITHVRRIDSQTVCGAACSLAVFWPAPSASAAIQRFSLSRIAIATARGF